MAAQSDFDKARDRALHKLTELTLAEPAFVAQKIREYNVMPLSGNPTTEELIKGVAEGHMNKPFIADLYAVADPRFQNAGGWNNAGFDPISAVATAVGDSVKGITSAITAKADQKTAVVNSKATTEQKMLDFITAKNQGFAKAATDVKNKTEDSVSKNMPWYIGGGVVLLLGIIVVVAVVLKNRTTEGNGGQ